MKNRRAIKAKRNSQINTMIHLLDKKKRLRDLSKATAKRWRKKAEEHRQNAEWFEAKGRYAMTLDPTTEEGRKALKENFDEMVDKIREISSCPEEFADMVNSSEILSNHQYNVRDDIFRPIE